MNKLISWCSENNLELNVNKTKQIIVDFRRKKASPIYLLLIDGWTVEIAQHFKFLVSTISNNLKWELNTDIIVKKAQQRLFVLRRLRSFGLTTQILLTFYRAAIESVLTFSMVYICYSEGKAKIEQSCKNCFQNNWQRPAQS